MSSIAIVNLSATEDALLLFILNLAIRSGKSSAKCVLADHLYNMFNFVCFFQRHRLKHRPAASAFMERVTHELDARWAKEQYEKRLALAVAST